MAASHNVYNPEDLEDDEEVEEESEGLIHAFTNNNMSTIANANANANIIINPSQNDVVVDFEDDDVDVDVDDDDDVDDSTSSSNPATSDHHHPDPSSLLIHHHQQLPPPPSVSAGEVTVALLADHTLPPDPKRQRIDEVTIASSVVASAIVEEKKPVPNDESRRLFQRLWTDEDEIELLQGFLEYTTSKGVINSSHHHDTTAFYDQIKSKLQLDFNKNQLVEKLRRLKKKYRNVMTKMGSGKEYVFKSPHDQATFEISHKIWCESGGGAAVRSGVVVEEGGFDDDYEKKTPRSRKRSRGGGVKIEEKQLGFSTVPNLQNSNLQQNVQNFQNMQNVGVVTPTATPIGAVTVAAGSAGPGQATNLIEETVRSCLSPIFKELLNNVMSLNGSMICGSRGLGFALSPMPLGLNGDLVADERWRKQQIMELEVYSKRLELVQDQIKAQLEELRSMGS